jgi:hypothetical protein
MKKSTKILLLLFFISFSTFANDNLGLVSYLVNFKFEAENHVAKQLKMAALMKAKLNNLADKDTAGRGAALSEINSSMIELLDEYAKVKSYSDQAILQLITDIGAKNRLCKYKEVNKVYKSGSNSGSTNVYVAKLNAAESELTTLKSKTIKQTKSAPLAQKSIYKNFSAIADPTLALDAVAGVVLETIKFISESNSTKVDRVTKVLDALRLSAAQDLLKASEETKDDEKDDKKK